jgi:hypothetical protein
MNKTKTVSKAVLAGVFAVAAFYLALKGNPEWGWFLLCSVVFTAF